MAKGRVDVWVKLLGGKDEKEERIPYNPKVLEERQRLQDEAKKPQALPPIPKQPLAG